MSQPPLAVSTTHLSAVGQDPSSSARERAADADFERQRLEMVAWVENRMEAGEWDDIWESDPMGREKVVGKKGKGKGREEMPKRGESSTSGDVLGYFDSEPNIIP